MQLGTTLLAAGEAGGYINLLKVVPVFLVLFIWARLFTWCDKDAPAAHLPREGLNVMILGSGIAGFLALLLLPGYLIAFPAMILLQAGGIFAYLMIRKNKVGLVDVWKEFAAWRASIIKTSRDRKREAKTAGAVTIAGKSGSPMPIPEADDPSRPSYDAVQTLLTDPLRKGAERIDLKPAEGAAAVQVTVDGVTYAGTSMDRNLAQAAIGYLKYVGKLDLNEKRRPQTGTVKVVIDARKIELEVATAGTTAGEFLRVQVDPKKRHDRRLPDLGLFPEQLQLVQDMIKDPAGIVLVAVPKGQGLTTVLYAILRAHDAFLTHIQTLERNQEADLEGITQTKVAAAATPEEENKQVEWMVSQQPDTVLLDQLTGPGTARELTRFAAEGKRVYVGMRAGSSLEALAQWRKLVGDDQIATKDLRMVIAGRVMRRLCVACKVGYTPDPDQIRKLNLDPSKSQTLYQARTQPARTDKGEIVPCTFCQELRYKGRFGIFELMLFDDAMKKTIAAGGSDNQIKALFRKQRGRFLQEVALSHVSQGETSVQEVLRVLRAEPGAAARAPAAAG